MCGIAGIIDLNRKIVNQDQIRAMTHHMVRRGPDDKGFFVNDHIVLGMRRLSIIDLQSGQQPITNKSESVVAVMNGEIYNYVELQKQLSQKGHSFQTQSDTEVLVHAYEEEGIDFIHQLNGMFAFALWDRRQQVLWIVRDRLGIKPLYWVQESSLVHFASDLLAIPSSKRGKVSEAGLIDYLSNGYVGAPRTLFSNVSKLSPGHRLRIDKTGLRTERWWHVEQKGQRDSISVDEAAHELEELLQDSVTLQLRSDVPLGVLLSGGVDSSAITALTALATKKPITSFTVNFSGKQGDDASFASQVAKAYNTEHSLLNLTQEAWLSGLDEVLQFMDEPIADSAIVPTYLISKFACEKGIKVLLTGAGGDELFGGYRRYFYPRLGSPEWIATTLPQPLRKAVALAWGTFQPHRGLRAGDPGIAYLSSIYGPDLGFYRKILCKGSFEAMMDHISQQGREAVTPSSSPDYAYARMRFDAEHYLVDNILSLTDKATMGTSVEGRVPLLDHRLVELAFSLPHEIKFLQKKPKGLLCQAVQSYLPQKLLQRKKEGFNAPVDEWTRDRLYPMIQEELSQRLCGELQELMKVPSLNALQFPKQPYRSNTLYSLYVLNRWCRQNQR